MTEAASRDGGAPGIPGDVYDRDVYDRDVYDRDVHDRDVHDRDVYEVFRQERDGGPMQHAGNLRAPDPELAAHYAREFYGRRQESVRLWVVARAAIRQVDDPDLLKPPLDRSFKKPAGYSKEIKRKLAEARELAR